MPQRSELLRAALGEEFAGADGGLLNTRLQDIVDSASRELRRPVAIDDRHMRLLAHTEHPSPVDEVRLLSILKRPLPKNVLAWFDAHGVRDAEGPVKVEPNEELGMDRRVCAPIRCHGHLLGFLWLIDREAAMTSADMERAAAIADAAGIVLYRDLILQDLDRSRERELLRDLLSPDALVRASAVAELIEQGLFWADTSIVAITATLPMATEHYSDETIRLTVDAALGRVRRRLAPKHGLHLVRPDHALLLVSTQEPSVREKGVESLAEHVHAELRVALAEHLHDRHVVAIGNVAESLSSAEASYQQALRASHVALAIPSFGHVIRWENLGVYKALAALPLDEDLSQAVIHRGLRSMLENPRRHFLVRTLETYLDHAGDMKGTAASLYLHRTSLYHRLRRIETLAQTDLSDGSERLALHLSLKVARLSGMDWSTPYEGDAVSSSVEASPAELRRTREVRSVPPA